MTRIVSGFGPKCGEKISFVGRQKHRVIAVVVLGVGSMGSILFSSSKPVYMELAQVWHFVNLEGFRLNIPTHRTLIFTQLHGYCRAGLVEPFSVRSCKLRAGDFDLLFKLKSLLREIKKFFPLYPKKKIKSNIVLGKKLVLWNWL